MRALDTPYFPATGVVSLTTNQENNTQPKTRFLTPRNLVFTKTAALAARVVSLTTNQENNTQPKTRFLTPRNLVFTKTAALAARVEVLHESWDSQGRAGGSELNETGAHPPTLAEKIARPPRCTHLCNDFSQVKLTRKTSSCYTCKCWPAVCNQTIGSRFHCKENNHDKWHAPACTW